MNQMDSMDLQCKFEIENQNRMDRTIILVIGFKNAICDGKTKAQALENSPADQRRLILFGRQFRDFYFVSDYCINNGGKMFSKIF